MAQGFYTLEEAAQKLGMSTQELNALAQKREIRAFADRGTWRFRAQDVADLARRRGISDSSETDLPATQAFTLEPEPAAARSGAPAADTSETDVLLVAQGSDLEVQPSGRMKPSATSGRITVPPPNDSDENIGLGGDVLSAPGDSQVRLDSAGISGRLPDSGVRLVDFDLKPIGEAPSSRRLPKPPSSKRIPPPAAYTLTPENLEKPSMSGSVSGPSPLGPVPTPQGSSEFDLTPHKPGAGDSIFEIHSPSLEALDLGPSQDDGLDFNEVAPAGPGTSIRGKAGSKPPKEDSDTFDLSMESSDEFSEEEKGPKTKQAKPSAKELSSEFDLSLNADESSSEFELSLEDDAGLSPLDEPPAKSTGNTARIPANAAVAQEATSDFELALDEDSGPVVDETGSEVVVIEEEDQGVRDVVQAAELAGGAAAVDDADAVEEVEEEEVIEPVAEAAPAEWGWWSLLHVPTAFVMLFTGFLLYEMVRSVWAYNSGSAVAGTVFNLVSSFTK